ncbi:MULTISPECIES: hypothetical protein, partial [unclassified Pseudomonas]|uniref:hypothetical protein n=1 Tax=unclassified Pseudomonas TaxID=196821 RepID=UPI002010569D
CDMRMDARYEALSDAVAGRASIPIAKRVHVAASKRRGMLSHAAFDVEVSEVLDAEIVAIFEGSASTV